MFFEFPFQWRRISALAATVPEGSAFGLPSPFPKRPLQSLPLLHFGGNLAIAASSCFNQLWSVSQRPKPYNSE
ncbi:MAG: hypothetical protein Q4F69_10515 [Bacteroidia bacterium]|nr:hypothetical protein [Bacteroidia bacterium]